MEVGGNLILTGGSISGAAIGTSGVTTSGPDTHVALSIGGSLSMNGATGGARIGSPSTAVGGGSITVFAANGIDIRGNSVVRSAGAIDMAATGGVRIASGGTLVAVRDGSIRLSGDGGASNLNGVLIESGVVQTDAGSIDIIGFGAAGNTSAQGQFGGVRLRGNALVQSTGTGSITITGTGGSTDLSAAGSGAFSRMIGVVMEGSALVSSAGGDLVVTGSGGEVIVPAGGTGDSRGIRINSGALQTIGGGRITLTGTGGTSTGPQAAGTSVFTGGVLVAGTLSTADGDITITGSGGTLVGTSDVLATGSRGVSLVGTITASGSGSILIQGSGGSSSTAAGHFGALLDGLSLSTNTGSVSIVSSAGNSSDPAANLVALLVQTSTTPVAINAGSGGMSVQANGAVLLNAGSGSISLNSAGAQSILVSSFDSAAGEQPGNIVANAFGAPITLSASGNQSIIAAGSLSLNAGLETGGTLSNVFATIVSNGAASSQTVTARDIELVGGVGGTTNFASIRANGDQVVTALNSLRLLGGSGGGLDQGNAAGIRSFANQSIVVGPGGLLLQGGSGTDPANTNNSAIITQQGTLGSQSVLITEGGALTMIGGSSARSNFVDTYTGGSAAVIRAEGASQTITLQGGAISLTGGSAGSNNDALFYIPTGSATHQVVSGASSITVVGGESGGLSGTLALGNLAGFSNEGSGSQSISTSGTFSLQGGAGSGNRAFAWSQGGQTVEAAHLSLQGGSAGTFNQAYISGGSAQTLLVGGLSMNGGSGGSDNSASISANAGSQAISVLASTGSFSSVGLQTMPAASLEMYSGDGGTNNFASITGAQQNIRVDGSLFMQGGASAGLGGLRIGGRGGAQAGTTQLSLSVGGDAFLSGGAGTSTPVFIGTSPQATNAPSTDISVQVGGRLDMSATDASGVVIGSLPNFIGGGNITLSAGQGIRMFSGNPNAPVGIRTTGSISLDAADFGLQAFNSSFIGDSIAIAANGVAQTAGIKLLDSNLTAVSALSIVTPGVLEIGSDSANARLQSAGSLQLSAGDLFIGPYLPTSVGTTTVSAAQGVALSAAGSIAVDAPVSGGSVLARSQGIEIGAAGRFTATAAVVDPLVLDAGSGSFVNGAGPDALAVPSGTRWLVYSADPRNDDRGGLIYDFKQYGKTYDDGKPILGSGNGFLYAVTPALELKANGAVRRVFDGTIRAPIGELVLTAVGAIDGDVVSLTPASALFGDKNVGSGKDVSISADLSASNGAAAVYGYLGQSSATPPRVQIFAPLGEISIRPVSIWTASTGGNWSDASKWDVYPETGNVAGVQIPSGNAFEVVYDGAAGPLTLQSLSNAQSLRLAASGLSFGQLQNSGTLTVGSGARLDLSGSQVSGSGRLVNRGALVLFNSRLFNPLDNFGLTEASGDNALSTVLNSGTMKVLAGLTTLTGDFMQDAESTTLGSAGGSLGSIRLPSGATMDIRGGALKGSGTIEGNLKVGKATVAPGFSPGSLSVSGDLTMSPESTLLIDLGGTTAGSYDAIAVAGTATLAGTLEVQSVNGFKPSFTDSFGFLNSTTVAGQFEKAATSDPNLATLSFNLLQVVTPKGTLALPAASAPASAIAEIVESPTVVAPVTLPVQVAVSSSLTSAILVPPPYVAPAPLPTPAPAPMVAVSLSTNTATVTPSTASPAPSPATSGSSVPASNTGSSESSGSPSPAPAAPVTTTSQASDSSTSSSGGSSSGEQRSETTVAAAPAPSTAAPAAAPRPQPAPPPPVAGVVVAAVPVVRQSVQSLEVEPPAPTPPAPPAKRDVSYAAPAPAPAAAQGGDKGKGSTKGC